MRCTCSNLLLGDSTDLADSFQEALGKHAFRHPAHVRWELPACPPAPSQGES